LNFVAGAGVHRTPKRHHREAMFANHESRNTVATNIQVMGDVATKTERVLMSTHSDHKMALAQLEQLSSTVREFRIFLWENLA